MLYWNMFVIYGRHRGQPVDGIYLFEILYPLVIFEEMLLNSHFFELHSYYKCHVYFQEIFPFHS